MSMPIIIHGKVLIKLGRKVYEVNAPKGAIIQEMKTKS